jgi:7-cyano-7-deazaguanine synthase
MGKCVVLVSGGLDSCVTLAIAHSQYGKGCIPLSFVYGQRHSREVVAAGNITSFYGLPAPYIVDLTVAFQGIGGSSLTSGITDGNPSKEHVDRPDDKLPSTFVPGRNIIMIAVAGAFAYTHGAGEIYGGWNAVDYSGYPDCRPRFLRDMEHALCGGLASEMILTYPLVHSSKVDIIRRGLNMNAPMHLSWSCYAGGLSTPCGECDSCKIRAEGFEKLGIPDPASA